MTENTKLWDKLGKTDPAHTKQFKRAGGFTGTAIKPMWSYKRMTEEFGPCGVGWGVNEPSFQVVPGSNNEVLVYCTVSVWYNDPQRKDVPFPSNSVFGVGGDKIVTHIKENKQYNRPERWENDDEAFKKAYTDAVTNALKMIGVGADVHMGMFDDNKYVNTMAKEFAEQAKQDEQPPYFPPPGPVPEPPAKSSAQLKRDHAWEKLEQDLEQDMVDVRSLVALERVKQIYRDRAKAENWNVTYKASLKDKFMALEDRIKRENPADAVDDILDTFPGAKIVNDRRVLQTPMAAGE